MVEVKCGKTFWLSYSASIIRILGTIEYDNYDEQNLSKSYKKWRDDWFLFEQIWSYEYCANNLKF